jgi:hypothetical protein
MLIINDWRYDCQIALENGVRRLLTIYDGAMAHELLYK